MKLKINSGYFHLRRPRLCRGFTLVELLISILIFAMMMSALATIYGTISRHMFQNYKQNILKTNLSVAMKVIQSRLILATRVDSPAFKNSENVLAFATNVDSQTGCSPVNQITISPTSKTLVTPNKWHYFCRAVNAKTGFNDLYYHTGNIGSDTGGCPCSAGHSNEWTGLGDYPVPLCGKGGGGTVTKILENAQLPLSGFMFSRRDTLGIREVDQVRVTLRTKKTLDDDRPIDVSLDTIVHTQITAP